MRAPSSSRIDTRRPSNGSTPQLVARSNRAFITGSAVTPRSLGRPFRACARGISSLWNTRAAPRRAGRSRTRTGSPITASSNAGTGSTGKLASTPPKDLAQARFRIRPSPPIRTWRTWPIACVKTVSIPLRYRSGLICKLAASASAAARATPFPACSMPRVTPISAEYGRPLLRATSPWRRARTCAGLEYPPENVSPASRWSRTNASRS